jgi:hypothetical protein
VVKRNVEEEEEAEEDNKASFLNKLFKLRRKLMGNV